MTPARYLVNSGRGKENTSLAQLEERQFQQEVGSPGFDPSMAFQILFSPLLFIGPQQSLFRCNDPGADFAVGNTPINKNPCVLLAAGVFIFPPIKNKKALCAATSSLSSQVHFCKPSSF